MFHKHINIFDEITRNAACVRYEITFDHAGVLAGWFAIWPSKSITVSQRTGRVDGIGTDVW